MKWLYLLSRAISLKKSILTINNNLNILNLIKHIIFLWISITTKVSFSWSKIVETLTLLSLYYIYIYIYQWYNIIIKKVEFFVNIYDFFFWYSIPYLKTFHIIFFLNDHFARIDHCRLLHLYHVDCSPLPYAE